MFISFGEGFQLGVDCIASVGAQRWLILGWHMTPRGQPVDLQFSTTDGQACRVDFLSRHPRPDVLPSDPAAAVVHGFSISIVAPEGMRGLNMAVVAGDRAGQANLTDGGANTDLFQIMTLQDWRTSFTLLRESLNRPAALPLFSYQYRPYGAFATWIAQMPLVQGVAHHMGVAERITASCSPAGEVALDFRFVGRSRGTVEIDVVAIARLRAEDDGPDEIVPLPLQDGMVSRSPGSLAYYGRIDWDYVPRLSAIELVAEITFDSERLWVRCHPREDTVPGFLDTLAAAPAGNAGHAMLRAVLDQRRLTFEALAATEVPGLPANDADEGLAELALIGVDSLAAVRLLHLLVPEIERAASSILFMGEAAPAAADIFARRGMPVEIATSPGVVLERAAVLGSGRLIALDLPRLARAAIEGNVAELLATSRGAALARLFVLHAAAGRSTALGDSLAQFVSLAEDPSLPWDPVNREWSSAFGAELVNDHIETMWRSAAEHAA
ncbi:hypothetical protein [Roseococcus sp. YIM B11640]|uniref:hypothetical protein n=1 Tax=Roseococcus sp. YIM B11640 TaxID=3133973 RepID=UPI003C7CAF62